MMIAHELSLSTDYYDLNTCLPCNDHTTTAAEEQLIIILLYYRTQDNRDTLLLRLSLFSATVTQKYSIDSYLCTKGV